MRAIAHQFRGIGAKLLVKAESIAKEKGLTYLEAWTRDDDWVNALYHKNGFVTSYSYLHVFLEGEEIQGVVKKVESYFNVGQAFAHYTGNEKEDVKIKFNRVHECFCYEKMLR